ncbi:MAG: Gfo/Idh/MocA family oxidoreductase [Planctomycetales bacterium]|nr:Gfo/Idh/MocA family oxidoreductase [Planctomycetales bacterium]
MHLTRSTTRRQFLQTGCRSITSTVVGYWTCHSTSFAADEVRGDRLNVGVIGVGNRGVDNVNGVATENVYALCDVDQRYLDEMHSRYPRARVYRDFRELPDNKSMDAVVVCTPDHVHACASIWALQRGLHVFCEKPMAHRLAQVRDMADVATRADRKTQVGNQHATSLGYRRVAEIVQSGWLGKLESIHAWTDRPVWPQGDAVTRVGGEVPAYLDWDLWLGPANFHPYRDQYHPFTWRAWWDFGSGALGDMGPHLLDPVLHAYDVTGQVSIGASSEGNSEASCPRWSTLRFHLPLKGGESVGLHWYDGGRRPSADVLGTERPPSSGALLLGEHGRLFIPTLGKAPIAIANNKSWGPPPASRLQELPSIHQEWLAACKTGGDTCRSFGKSITLTELCLAGCVAIRTEATEASPLLWSAETGELTGRPNIERYQRDQPRDGWGT